MAVSSTGRQPLARLTGWLLLSTQQSLPVPALVCWLGANLCPTLDASRLDLQAWSMNADCQPAGSHH